MLWSAAPYPARQLGYKKHTEEVSHRATDDWHRLWQDCSSLVGLNLRGEVIVHKKFRTSINSTGEPPEARWIRAASHFKELVAYYAPLTASNAARLGISTVAPFRQIKCFCLKSLSVRVTVSRVEPTHSAICS